MSHDAGMGTYGLVLLKGTHMSYRTRFSCSLTTWSLDVLECMPLKSLKDYDNNDKKTESLFSLK